MSTMGFDLGSFWAVTGSSLLALVLLMAVTAVVGHRQGRVSVVDTTWGLGFVLVALVAALVGDGAGWRRVLLLVLVAVWGLRLAWHVTRRNAGKGEDPRYTEMLEKEGGNPTLVAIRKVYAVQGAALWFVSLPLQVSAAAGGGVAWVAVVGVLLWLLGVSFEAVGDAQLARFKADPANKGKVMDRGLWSWTRHPNYFGDSSVWWGLFLVAASAWPGVLTVLSPVVMTYFLVYGTGAKLLERHMAERPGYREYQQRTSYFLPRPPRRATGAGRG
ncbi:steroid 5-alpha reductase family enzyme [Phycicoccus sp. 3266]|nr:steroid 5-alpha reductase family enzyme [Phycicoccus sp. 3266]